MIFKRRSAAPHNTQSVEVAQPVKEMVNPSLITPGQSPSPVLQLKDVSKIYRTGAGDFAALQGINLQAFQGEFLGIVGKSGAGKTTLLNCISGVSEVSSGEVWFYPPAASGSQNGKKPYAVHTMGENDLASWRGANLGIVYQSFELMPQLSLVNNILLPPDFLGSYSRKISREHALELLEMVELSEHAYKLPAHISGGQKQRVAIARALVNDPPLILADEPTGNLDTVTAERIYQVFEKLVQQGKTVLLVTHDSNMSARFSRRITISDGEIVENPGETEVTSLHKYSRHKQLTLLQEAIDSAESLGTNGDGPVMKTAAIPGVRSRRNGKSNQPAVVDTSQPAIVLHDVVKTYSNAAGEFAALKGINLQMNYGQFISIVGKSGSGKSTLLNMITGIDHPTSGQILVGGEDIYKLSESKRALWRGRSIGIVFQFFQLLPTLTLLENTMLPMDYCNIYPSAERPGRALELLKKVGLEDQAYKLPAAVSSGQQQSAAIARALATDPPIILADEPTGNLDSRSAERILTLFSQLSDQGKSILIVTHDTSFTRRTDQTVILSDGEIIDEAIAQALPLLNHPQMLEATRQAQSRIYSPGEVIVCQGDRIDHFFAIAQGEVDVVVKNQDCPEVLLARLGKGQYFGEVELMHSEHSIASVRASHDCQVELRLLAKGEFLQLLKGSPATQEVVAAVAQKRLEENLGQNGDCA